VNAVGKSRILKVAFAMTIFILIAPVFVAAHAPSSVDLSYDEATDELDVTVTHTGVDGTSHRISEIQVYKNDVLQTSETYSSQTTTSTHTDTFTVAADAGDVLRVVAICSISGQREGTLTVGGTTTDTNGGTDYIPLTLLIAVIIITLGVVMIVVRVARRR
jgi:hypothetical protein